MYNTLSVGRPLMNNQVHRLVVIKKSHLVLFQDYLPTVRAAHPQRNHFDGKG